MNRLCILVALLLSLLLITPANAQVDEDELGAWYMYFFGKQFEDSQWGFQGDFQYRNWDLGGDLEQLLLRAGVTYRPKNINALLTFGYGNITTGTFGPSDASTHEERIYQEALLPHRLGDRIYLRHRFRFEQRWVNDQDFRTRFRYALFLDVPLNQTDLSQGAIYLAFYNEVFINGQQDIGDGRTVETFDRNRIYGAVGYSLSDKLRLQAGYMFQDSNTIEKGQFQLSLHQTF